ncbi:hypothetical protein BP6252_00994 [Coleophoma cylindrospora]|uniref:Uncharacterized protein n=1 Tax=Coleophoma cylindrospora TaxID=1849047 RepID=A0A3D8SRN9_9HELO|nr:hypothetical protein BP6252_00994 [Coleophoma cylindrospora]
MSANVVFFSGAPESRSLNWRDPRLLDGFSEPVARFAGLDEYDTSIIPASESEHPSWRSIPLEREHVVTGFSQDHVWKPDCHNVSFLTTSDITSFIEDTFQSPGGSNSSSVQSAEEVLSQYYEHSYAVHEDIPSSQIPPDSGPVTDSFRSNFSSFRTSEGSFQTQDNSVVTSCSPPSNIPVFGRLHSLDEIPSASYLNSIQPQTMTVNLVAGIISLPAARAIQTRRGAAIGLVEVLVGDETKSGFVINFWLPHKGNAAEDRKGILKTLRPQDVVLVKNVALSSFRGRVYGQSLRKDMTKIHLLHRTRIDKDDFGGCYRTLELVSDDTQLGKTRKVRDWVAKFVGVGASNRRKATAAKAATEILPPDTQ